MVGRSGTNDLIRANDEKFDVQKTIKSVIFIE